VRQRPDARDRTDELERASLSTWATLAAESKGRDVQEEPDPLRTAYQIDRDRLSSCTAFARLAAKTFAFEPRPGGGWRTQLDQTLLVARLARTLGRALRVNEDLVEAIALGHAFGAAPFGPAGREALAAFSLVDEGEQALKVVEQDRLGEPGLALTWEVRDGILHADGRTPGPATIEGQVVVAAVRLAAPRLDPDVALQLIGEIARATGDGPELVVESHIARVLSAAPPRVGGLDARQDHRRALHCMQSLLVLATELLGADDDPDRAFDAVITLTDAEALARYDAAFRPSGPSSQDAPPRSS